MIDLLIKQIQNNSSTAHGGNKKCWLLGGYALLKGRFKPEDMEYVKETSQFLCNEGVAIVPTVEYKVMTEAQYGYVGGYILQRRAPGEELYPCNVSEEAYYDRIEQLSKQSQEFYDKYVSDYMTIIDNGLMIDPSKGANFFYTPNQIHFIDLNKSERNVSEEMLYIEAACVMLGGGACHKYNQNREKQAQVLNKLSVAFIKKGLSREKLLEIAQQRFPNIVNEAFHSSKNLASMTSNNLLKSGFSLE